MGPISCMCFAIVCRLPPACTPELAYNDETPRPTASERLGRFGCWVVPRARRPQCPRRCPDPAQPSPMRPPRIGSCRSTRIRSSVSEQALYRTVGSVSEVAGVPGSSPGF